MESRHKGRERPPPNDRPLARGIDAGFELIESIDRGGALFADLFNCKQHSNNDFHIASPVGS